MFFAPLCGLCASMQCVLLWWTVQASAVVYRLDVGRWEPETRPPHLSALIADAIVCPPGPHVVVSIKIATIRPLGQSQFGVRQSTIFLENTKHTHQLPLLSLSIHL